MIESSRCYIFESTITGNAFPKLLLSVEKSKSMPREVDIPEFPWYGRDKNKESQGYHIMEWVYRIRPADPPDDSATRNVLVREAPPSLRSTGGSSLWARAHSRRRAPRPGL